MANAKYAIFKAKVENEIVEILLKSDVTNIYLEDGTTTLASKLAEMITTISAKADSTDVTAEIKQAIADLVGTAPETMDTLGEMHDYLESHEDEYTALVELVGQKATTAVVEAIAERVTALETKMATIEEGAQVNKIEKIFVNDVEQTISEKGVNISVPTGAMASKDEVSEDDLADALKEKVNAASEGNHSHLNKAELDLIESGDKTKWDGASEKAHEHSNKALLDTYTQTETDLADAVSKKHSHANVDVLDGITADDVTAWDSKTNTYIQSAQPTEMTANDIWIQLL